MRDDELLWILIMLLVRLAAGGEYNEDRTDEHILPTERATVEARETCPEVLCTEVTAVATLGGHRSDFMKGCSSSRVAEQATC